MTKAVRIRVKNKSARYAAVSRGAHPKVITSGYKPEAVLERAKKKLKEGEEPVLVYLPKRDQAFVY